MTQTPATPTAFPPGTTKAESQAFTLAAVTALAAGFGPLYIAQPTLAGGGPINVNLDGLIRDAGTLAVNLKREADARFSQHGGN